MTLLKDVRLLLIIGLAILCLIALKMCASTYEPMASGDTSSTAVVADSEDNASEATNAVATETADPTENSEEAAETEEATATETADPTENAEEAAETEEATATVDADTAEDSTAVAEADVAETTLPDTTSPDTEATAAAEDSATEEADSAVASTEAPATEGAVTEQVTAQIQSAVPAAEPVVVTIDPIVLRDTAVSGEFMPDLTTDIESVQDGLSQYAEKLNTAKALLDKLKGAGQ